MNLPINTIGVAALQAASLALALIPGQQKLSDVFSALAGALQAGGNIDSHMAEVKAKLEAGGVATADWDDVLARIESDSARLQRA